MYQDLAPSNFLPWNNAYYNFTGYNTASGNYVTYQNLSTYPLTISYCTGPTKHQKCISGLNETYIENEVKKLFTNGTILPAANTYYPIHFDPSTNFGSGTFGTAWCAYHDFVNFTLSGTAWTIPFAVIPDNANTRNCGTGF